MMVVKTQISRPPVAYLLLRFISAFPWSMRCRGQIWDRVTSKCNISNITLSFCPPVFAAPPTQNHDYRQQAEEIHEALCKHSQQALLLVIVGGQDLQKKEFFRKLPEAASLNKGFLFDNDMSMYVSRRSMVFVLMYAIMVSY